MRKSNHTDMLMRMCVEFIASANEKQCAKLQSLLKRRQERIKVQECVKITLKKMNAEPCYINGHLKEVVFWHPEQGYTTFKRNKVDGTYKVTICDYPMDSCSFGKPQLSDAGRILEDIPECAKKAINNDPDKLEQIVAWFQNEI